MSSELCRHPRAELIFSKHRDQEDRSIRELREWEGVERVAFDSEPEVASRSEISARREEQVDRVVRMLDLGKRLTPEWLNYAKRIVPHLIFSEDRLQT